MIKEIKFERPNEKKGKKQRKPMAKKKLTAKEIREDLEGYEMIKTKKELKSLEQFTRLKYLKKSTGEYKKGGLLLSYNPKENYIVLQGFGKDRKGQSIKFSLNLDDVILFKEMNVGKK